MSRLPAPRYLRWTLAVPSQGDTRSDWDNLGLREELDMGQKSCPAVLGLERPRGAQQPLSPLPSFGGTREREVSFLFEPLCFGAYVAQQLSSSLTHTLDSRTSWE